MHSPYFYTIRAAETKAQLLTLFKLPAPTAQNPVTCL
jgi:hypothetical protein